MLRWTWALFLALCLIWGFTYPVLKIGLSYAPPLAFTAARAAAGGLALFVYAAATTGRLPRDATTHRSALVLGLANVAAFWGLMNLGLTRISAGESSILTYTQPLLVGVLAWVWLGEVLSLRVALGLLLGFAGVATVVADKVSVGEQAPWLGYAYALGGAIAWAVGTVYFRANDRPRGARAADEVAVSPRLARGTSQVVAVGARKARLDILWVTSLQALYGAVPLAILAYLLERPSVAPSWGLAWTLLFTGLGSSALAYVIWFHLLRHRAAAEVTAYVFLVPAFAVLSGALVLGERLGPTALLGAALILLGIFVVNRPRVR